jgi:hypothetical protein
MATSCHLSIMNVEEWYIENSQLDTNSKNALTACKAHAKTRKHPQGASETARSSGPAVSANQDQTDSIYGQDMHYKQDSGTP